MSSQPIDQRIKAAFAHATFATGKSAEKLRVAYPQAIAFCNHAKTTHIFFEAIGDHFAEVDLQAIQKAKTEGHRPIVVAIGKGVKAYGPHFHATQADVVCEIAGNLLKFRRLRLSDANRQPLLLTLVYQLPALKGIEQFTRDASQARGRH